MIELSSRKQAQARHIHALTMSRPGIHCVETQSLVLKSIRYRVFWFNLYVFHLILDQL